ncbi:LysR substrate-binding domain-containing protein [Bacillaceae bacterium IKA-2]|nr:LysR substrate-binding domain-containing protein [Bacillaceae bacterium IKA-2]
MDLHQLKTFYHVAHLLNFSKAAQKVSLSQPAVSRQIESLEKHFGLDLFYRISKKIELTDAGRRLLQYTEQLLALAEQTEKAMNSLKNIDEGQLTIGAGTTVGNYILSPLVLEFSKRYPNIKTKLIIAKTSEIIGNIKEGLIDTAVIAKSVNHPEFYYQPIFRDEITLLTSPNNYQSISHAETLADLSNEVFLLREHGSNTRECIDLLMAKHHFKPKKIIELGTNEAIKHSILKGYGIGFLSRFTAQLEIDHKLLLSVKLKEECTREFSTINQKGKYTSPIMLIFTSFLKKNIHSHLNRK